MALRWSPEVAMTRKEIDYFLGSRLIARLATNDPSSYPSSYPRVTPVWYYWNGQFCLYRPWEEAGVHKEPAARPEVFSRC